ncbi:MAG: bifunctional oligoribonuclease/PAP phosphatase NrnA [Oscillospiraceae bacterium]|nr:bifunctional oligoribonuclease/PAP phosphatase NrnA [Oscillospiraceae bacterium]
MLIDFETAVNELRKAENVLVLTHANPDGDTLGSGFALVRILRQLGKKARLLNNEEIPKKFSYLYEDLKQEDFREETVIGVDIADRVLLGKETEEKYGDRVNLDIDHHGTNRLFAEKTYVEADSASCCEIIFLLAKALGITIDKGIADCLYTGCSTDTGCFRYSNVTERTHKIAAELLSFGADHAAINVKMFETKSFSLIKLQTMALEQLELHFDGRVSFLTVTRKMLDETGARDDEIDALVALSRQIEGVQVGVTFKEKPDGVFKASVRTHEGINAADICSAFSGGGHERAAGCSFSVPIEQAKSRMLSELQKYFQEG